MPFVQTPFENLPPKPWLNYRQKIALQFLSAFAQLATGTEQPAFDIKKLERQEDYRLRTG
jgi:hypothetical protein